MASKQQHGWQNSDHLVCSRALQHHYVIPALHQLTHQGEVFQYKIYIYIYSTFWQWNEYGYKIYININWTDFLQKKEIGSYYTHWLDTLIYYEGFV